MVLRVEEDLRAVPELKAALGSILQELHESKRPVTLTEDGQPVAVLMTAHEYEEMQQRLELLREVIHAGEELDAGRGIPHEAVRESIRKSRRK